LDWTIPTPTVLKYQSEFKMKPVSIIIPNWNGADLLRSYLPSVVLAGQRYPADVELIVVDDASTDSSVSLVAEVFTGVKLVRHEHNQGFGKTCWSGAQTAQNPILILLNSDVKVETDFIAPLADALIDPDVFAASPLILDDQGNLNNVTISIPYFKRGKIRYKSAPLQQLQTPTESLPNPWCTLFPIGAAFAVKRDRFLELKGFDDLFNPFYYEDTDLGFRAWRRGWRCIVIPESRVTHFEKGTIAHSFKHISVSIIRKRNRLFYLWKNLTSPRLLWQHFGYQLLRLCYRPFCFDFKIHIATILAIPGFLKALRRRREEQNHMVNSEEEIFKIISAANMANRQLIDSSSISKIARGV